MNITETVLVINSGSSSLKYQLVDPNADGSVASGLVERIGEPISHITHTSGDQVVDEEKPVADHSDALREVLRLFDEVGPKLSEANIVAVGHRVVQGGRHFDSAKIVTDRIRDLIAELSPLAPLHNPPNLKGIDVARELLPDVPHVVVFDTAFFQSLPEEAATYALDKDVAEKYSIRRYGAHGTSHQFVSDRVAEIVGTKDICQIVLHLGNGASASAVKCGKAVDTTMGLTPLEGLVMGTRTGDIDPAAVFHLQRVAGMSVDEVDTLFNKQSGLKGLTGDNDMRAVRSRADSDDPDARLAIDVLLHRLVKYVGAYAAQMGALDVLTFTAGIGENDMMLRKELCERLSLFGVELDEAANAIRSKEPRTISTPNSKVQVLVVPTNEELAIAQQALALIK
ncbi:MAG: acetate kinase [Actinomycetaceae bacterium]|nr:acetate kinase [Actinomycetaceae bacterium]